MDKNLNKYISELIQEIEKEIDESTTSGNVSGYSTPKAFSDNGSKDKNKKKKIATQLGMKLVGKVNEASFRPNSGTMSGGTYGLDNRKYQLKRDVKGVRIGDYTNVILPKGTIIYNIPGGVFAHHDVLAAYQSGQNKYFNKSTFKGISIRREKNVILSIEKNSKILESVNEATMPRLIPNVGERDDYKLKSLLMKNPTVLAVLGSKEKNFIKRDDVSVYGVSGKNYDFIFTDGTQEFEIVGKDRKLKHSLRKARRKIVDFYKKHINESVNEAKIQRPVNRWLAIKNDETKHPHKKMAMGLKELKYQLAETQKFFNWYNKIKTMNELDSSDYWKRTNKHIYKIKERLINIARTIQEIEK